MRAMKIKHEQYWFHLMERTILAARRQSAENCASLQIGRVSTNSRAQK
jgi:hypothetical protein